MDSKTEVFHPKGDIFLLVTRHNEEKDQADVEDSRLGEEGSSSGSETIRLQVSSMHLITASPVFKAMLSEEFKEGGTLRKFGSLEVPLLDDDPAALIILLNIIHGHSRKVPRRFDLPMLAKLAMLIDYYQLYEVVEVYSDFWMTCLENMWVKFLTKMSKPRELLQSLCVCWVFKSPDGFAKVTKRISRKFEGTISESHTRDLPIPDAIIAALNSQRNDVLTSVRTFLQESRSKYLSGRIICQNRKEDCDAMVLGGIMKILEKKYLDDSPLGEFHKSSLEHIVSMLGVQRISRLCGGGGCGIWSRWNDVIEGIKTNTYGMNLPDFTTTPYKGPRWRLACSDIHTQDGADHVEGNSFFMNAAGGLYQLLDSDTSLA